MRYLCLSCGARFREPQIMEEKHGEPHRAGERFWASPCCGEEFVPVRPCEDCGQVYPERELNYGLCAGCGEAAVERLRQYLRSAFTNQQRELLNEAFEAVALTQAEQAKVRE